MTDYNITVSWVERTMHSAATTVWASSEEEAKELAIAKVMSGDVEVDDRGEFIEREFGTHHAELTEKLHGTIVWDGKVITLCEGARSREDAGTHDWEARGVDYEGNRYLVMWDSTPEWKEREQEWLRLLDDSEYAAADAMNMYDASNAADWDNPVDVVLK